MYIFLYVSIMDIGADCPLPLYIFSNVTLTITIKRKGSMFSPLEPGRIC